MINNFPAFEGLKNEMFVNQRDAVNNWIRDENGVSSVSVVARRRRAKQNVL